MRRYLDALSEQGAVVTLAGREQWIGRARLGRHLQLERILEKFEIGKHNPDVASRLIRGYLETAGMNIEGAAGIEMLAAFLQLRQLNTWQWTLPFMTEEKPPQGEKPIPYDYLDRSWAWWVHKLASRYGWTRDEIFNLWPEEAACYLQEIFVAEFNEEEARRSLSEVAYRYDKHTKTSKFIPSQRPGWMVPRIDPKPVRILRSMLPVGLILDLDGNPVIH